MGPLDMLSMRKFGKDYDELNKKQRKILEQMIKTKRKYQDIIW